MTVSLLRLTPLPGRQGELASLFIEADVFGHSSKQDGWLGGELLVPDDERSPLAVIARWRDPVAYAGWLAAPIREEISAKLAPFLEDAVESTPGEIFTIAHEARAS
jgi:heme-degrading monooxygenase HmoA